MEQNYKRILKNTVFLYVRMFIMMCLSFFTTRIVLEKLGANDYGINNVVGGFVSMFSLLNNILQAGTRRFLTLYLGKGNENKLKMTFSTCFVIHLTIAIIIVLILEIFGLWFLNNELNIETNRIVAANWVLQFSIVNIFLQTTLTPFTGAIVAHEKFDVYAYLGIIDIIAKLLVVYLLVTIPYDKLIVYAGLLTITSAINVLLTQTYSITKFKECSLSLRVDKPLFKEIVKFSSWSTIGHLSAILNQHVVNILLNIFFGTLVNAARGLAVTVTVTVRYFVDGFITASVPQLVKFYGSGEKDKLIRLVYNSSQMALFMLAIFTVPIMLEIDYVLKIWLTEVPEYTSAFIKITIIICYISYSNSMVDQAVNAIGRVKEMNLYVTPLYLTVLPIDFVMLKLGFGPTIVYWVSSVPIMLAMFPSLWIMKRFYDFPAVDYFLNVFVKYSLMVIISAIPAIILEYFMEPGLYRFLSVCSLSVLCTITVMYNFALPNHLRTKVKSIVLSKLHLK